MGELLQRIILLSDIHFGAHSNSKEWFHNIYNFFTNVFIPYLEKEEIKDKDDVDIVIIGDVNDIKQAISTYIQNKQIDLFRELAQYCPIYLLVGNHDGPMKHDTSINSLKPLGLINGVNVIHKPQIKQVRGGKEALFLPWMGSKKREKQTIEKWLKKMDNPDYLFAHTAIAGFTYEGLPVEESEANTMEVFEDFGRVYSGHIHKKQEKENVLFIGSPYHLRANEAENEENGFYDIDLKTGEEKFVENTSSPRYRKINLFTLMEMTVEEANDLMEDCYVDVIMPTKLVYSIDTESIRDVLDGYRSLSFGNIAIDDDEIDADKLIGDEEIKFQAKMNMNEKLMEYVDDVESVKSGKQYIKLSPKVKKRLKSDLKEIYSLVT